MSKEQHILALLRDAKEKHGCLSEDVVQRVSQTEKISLGKLYSVLSFYSFLGTKPAARYAIRLCKSWPCYRREIKEVEKALKDRWGKAPRLACMAFRTS